MKVSLMITCLGEVFYPDVGKDVVEVLERLGCEIDFPAGQICCGQPAFNSGYQEEAKKAAKNMITAFADSEYIVCPSGSCAAMVGEYKGLFEDEPDWLRAGGRWVRRRMSLHSSLSRSLGWKTSVPLITPKPLITHHAI